MLTYRQFLSESTRHELIHDGEQININDMNLVKGDVYYTNEKGNLDREDGPSIITFGGSKLWYKDGLRHREDGPAIEYRDGMKDWFLFNKRIGRRSMVSDENKWLLLKGSIGNNFEILNSVGMNYEMQEYVCQNRPDLVSSIKDLDPELVKKYQHEKELGKVDL
jgi:hypothetical protein